MGMGVLLLGQPQKRDMAGYSYKVNFTSFTLNPASLQATVGGTEGNLPLFAVSATHIGQLRIIMSSLEVWQGRPWAHLAVQLLGSHGQPVVVSESLDVVIYIDSSNISSCTVGVNESYCLALVHFADSRFGVDGSSVSLTAKVGTNPSVSSDITATLKTEPLARDGSVTLASQRNHVFPGESGQLAIRANYSQQVAGFDATCESTVGLSVESDGSFSVLSANRSGGMTVDTNGLQATRRSNQNSGSEVLFLLNVPISEPSSASVNVTCTLQGIVLQNLEKVVTKATSIRRSATVSVSQNGVAGVVAHASQYTLFNTAALNGKEVTLPLWTSVLYRNGFMASSGATCNSSDSSVLKVNSDCSNVFLNGTETPGQANISFFAEEILQFQLFFDVWGPVGDITLKVDDSILNRLADCNMEEFQETRVRATASISNGPMCSTGNCVTGDVSHLLTFSTSAENITRVDPERAGVVKGVGEGVANITVSNSTLPVLDVEVQVSQQSVVATCLHVFVVSDIVVTQTSSSEQVAGGELAADLLLRQELCYADSRAEVIAVVVFNDSSRLVVNVDSRWNMNVLPSNLYSRSGPYIFPVQPGQATVVVDASCGHQPVAVQGNTTLNISLAEARILSIMQEPSDRSYIVHESDPSSAMFGSLLLKVFIKYDNHTADVTEFAQYQVERDSPLILEFINGTCNVTTNRPGLNRTDLEGYEVKVNYSGHAAELNVSVVQTTSVSVAFRPYPAYVGSQDVNITTLHAVNGVYPTPMLEASAVLSNGVITALSPSAFSANVSSGNSNITAQGGVKVLRVPDKELRNVVVTVHFDSVSGNATLHLNASHPTVIEVANATVRKVNGAFYVDCELQFADEMRVFSLYSTTQVPLYVQLVHFEPGAAGTGVINISSSSGRIQVEQNFYKPLDIIVMSATNMTLFDVVSFEANLPPLDQQLDFGAMKGLPLPPIEKDTLFEIPIVLNAGEQRVGVMEAELVYDANIMEFMGAKRGQSWNLGSLYYNNDKDNSVVRFGGILTGGASHTVEVATMTFRANEAGLANFSGTVLYTARAEFSANLTIKVDEESPAADVAVLVNSPSRRRREITSLEYRIRRQSSSSQVLGDMTGDGVADLRDTVVLQFYTLGVASNFTSDLGMDVMSSPSFETLATTINANDLDGDNVITVADLVSSEELSEGLINIVQSISVRPSNGESCSSISISGCVRSSSGDLAAVSTAVLFLHISSSNASFQGLFDNAQWQRGVVRYNHSNDPQVAGGIVQADLDSMTSCFNVSATTKWEEVIVDIVIFHGIRGTSFEVLEGGGTKDIPAFSTDVQFMTEETDRLVFDNGLAPLKRITCPVIPSTSTSSSIAVPVTTSSSIILSSSVSSEEPSTSLVLSPTPSTSIILSSSGSSEAPSMSPVLSPTPPSSVIPSSSVTSEEPSTSPVLSPTPSPSVISSSSVSSEVPSTSLLLSPTTSTTSSTPLGERRTSSTVTSTIPTSTPTTPTLPPGDRGGDMAGVIGGVAGLAVVIVAIAIAIVVVVLVCCYRKMNKKDSYKPARMRLNSNHILNGKTDYWSRTEEQIVSLTGKCN